MKFIKMEVDLYVWNINNKYMKKLHVKDYIQWENGYKIQKMKISLISYSSFYKIKI